MTDAMAQMQARSGPYNDLARERSRVLSEAYWAAGSPRKVSTVIRPGHTVSYAFHVRVGNAYRRVPATQADADA
jgi:hypothetical protein